MPQENILTRSEAISQVAAKLDAPIALDEFAEQVLSIWTSRAKNPKAGVRQDIRDNHLGKTLVLLDDKTLLPMQLAMPGVSFRVPLSRQEVNKGCLYIYPNFMYLLPENLAVEDIQLVDSTAHSIPAEIVVQQEKVSSLFGEHIVEKRVLLLGWWYKKHKVKRQDYLLITILDWPAGKYRLEIESNRDYRRQADEIAASNRELADMLFDHLEEARYESLRAETAIPTAYARLKDKLPVPADHWLPILENDPRMYWTGHDIRYTDSFSPLESLIQELRQDKASAQTKKLSAEQRNQVYRFKAHFKYEKGIWRRIEIQGGQTMADLDGMMRGAFQHDFMDHLSGFWKLIRRGNSRRFREVELATINPFEGGKGADFMIGNLELAVGDRLKYVYDFGDWIEHHLELEDITAPEAEADYPQVVAQNKPRYQYCPSCREKGHKTIATYICLRCSSIEQKEVIMCEECISPEHEEHYMKEIVY